MTVRFLEIAEIELDQAIRWHEVQAPGLGNAFLIEVLSAADRTARFPERGIRWAKAYAAAALADSRMG